MGRVGSCYDNAVAESLLASLKAEIGTRVWATRAEARQAVFAYIINYNRKRLHSTLKRRPRTRPASAIVHLSPSRHETPVSDPGWNLTARLLHLVAIVHWVGARVAGDGRTSIVNCATDWWWTITAAA